MSFSVLSDIDHVAIAVRSLEEGIETYRTLLEREPEVEIVEEQGVRVAAFPLEHGRVELLEPLDEDSPVAAFLERHGEGLHHVAFRTGDADEALDRAARSGLEPLNDAARPGAGGYRIGFLHPNDLHGVLVEMAQPPGGNGGSDGDV